MHSVLWLSGFCVFPRFWKFWKWHVPDVRKTGSGIVVDILGVQLVRVDDWFFAEFGGVLDRAGLGDARGEKWYEGK